LMSRIEKVLRKFGKPTLCAQKVWKTIFAVTSL